MLAKKNKGFTLVELVITIAIIGILASAVYPSYVDFVRSSNRAEAQRELLVIANLQEQFFLDQRRYTADMTELNLRSDPFITSSGNYSIDATLTASGFNLVATAQGAQATDTTCATFTINEAGRKTATDTSCWEK